MQNITCIGLPSLDMNKNQPAQHVLSTSETTNASFYKQIYKRIKYQIKVSFVNRKWPCDKTPQLTRSILNLNLS